MYNITDVISFRICNLTTKILERKEVEVVHFPKGGLSQDRKEKSNDLCHYTACEGNSLVLSTVPSVALEKLKRHYIKTGKLLGSR